MQNEKGNGGFVDNNMQFQVGWNNSESPPNNMPIQQVATIISARFWNPYIGHDMMKEAMIIKVLPCNFGT